MYQYFMPPTRQLFTTRYFSQQHVHLTHWGRVTHICVGNLTIIGPDNGLSPGRRQAIIWTNDGILLIGPWGTNFSEILTDIHTFSFKKIHLKMSSVKWRPFFLGLNVLSEFYRTFIVFDMIDDNVDAIWRNHRLIHINIVFRVNVKIHATICTFSQYLIHFNEYA